MWLESVVAKESEVDDGGAVVVFILGSAESGRPFGCAMMLCRTGRI